MLPAAAALADDFITDVLVVGNKNQTEFNSLISSLVSAGWTDINQDLNQGCGGNSAYIHLLYKKQNSTANSGTAITGFYIRTGSNPPDNLTFEGRTYYLVPCQGSATFVNGHGDLNSGCGSGSAYIFLYYTKDVLSDNSGVTGITFNTTQSGALGANGGSTGYDLNSGGGAYIYMHLTTATGANVVPLNSGSGDVQLLNGHILTGTGGADTRVSVADGATVTFSGVNITAIANNSSHPWPGIECSGNATIVLNGSTTNSVKGGFRSPGIHVAANKTLTIQGSGTLNATGRDYAAGIGSGQSHSSCGNITISGGTVTATGGQNASGIGSGAEQQSCGNITVSGGTVNATGLTYAAGIGSGNQFSCGTITISGIRISNNNNPQGLFGYCQNSTVKNIILTDAEITGNWSVGGIVGENYVATVENCLVANNVSVSGYQGVGGIVGENRSGSIADCQVANNVTISSNSGYVGTIVGKNVNSTLHRNYYLGCTVNDVANATNVGTNNGDITENDGAVSGYAIHTATDWDFFCDALQDNATYNRFIGDTVRLAADITVTRMAGSSTHDFMGTFDGQGHTLTLAYGSAENPITEEYAAPFHNLENGAYIHSLHVDGDIYTSNKYASGIAGNQYGTVSISDCRSSVVIHSSKEGDGTHGGFVATQHGTLTVSGCVFDGRLLTTNGTTLCSGLVGYHNNGTCTISDCFYAPATNINPASGETYITNGAIFCRNYSGTPENCYYTEALGTAQGKLALTNLAVLPVGEPTATYDVSSLTLYGNGIQFGEVFYYDTERNFLRTIAGYGTGDDGWNLIASPVANDITPTAANGFLTEAYDLFRFNQAADLEWENWKDTVYDNYHFDLASGRGYLYASQTETTLVFTGTPYSGTGEVTLTIVRLGEGEMLPKLQIREGNTKVYLPQGGADYAVACVGRDGVHTVSTEGTNAFRKNIFTNTTGDSKKMLSLRPQFLRHKSFVSF